MTAKVMADMCNLLVTFRVLWLSLGPPLSKNLHHPKINGIVMNKDSITVAF